jgi:hypothetical protein
MPIKDRYFRSSRKETVCSPFSIIPWDWPGMWNGGIHLYGHIHGNQEPLTGSMDVGVDVWGGRPVTLDEIEEAVRPFAKPAGKAPFRVQFW